MMMMMMMTEMGVEMSVYYVHLTRLIAREDFIKSQIYVLLLGRDTNIAHIQNNR